MCNKNQENCKIGNRKQSAVPYSVVVPPWYSILFCTTSTNQMHPEVKPYKEETRKGKNESSVRKQYAELKSGRNSELEREMHFTISNGTEMRHISSVRRVTVYEK